MGRIASIDTLRVAAILAVLTLHSRLFRGPGELAPWERVAEAVLDHAARFGVPFFFFISGYLLGIAQLRGGSTLGRAVASFKRLAILYVAWSVILILWEVGGRMIQARLCAESLPWPPEFNGADVVGRSGYGVRMHLWFLPALAQAVLVVAAVARFGTRAALAVGALLFVVGLAGGSYADLTGFDLGVLSRNGPFFGTLFVAAGFAGAVNGWRPTLIQAVLVTGTGALIQAAEVLALHQFAGLSLVDERFNYFGGTALMGIGVGLIALACPQLGAESAWPKCGVLTLGVYAVHLQVQQQLADINPLGGIAGQVLLVAASYGISLGIAASLARTRLGRRLVG